MKQFLTALLALSAVPATFAADNSSFVSEIRKWQSEREKKLRADNGWLTLAGRYRLKDGANTFGVGKDNDIVLPAELKGTGPDRLGTLTVDAAAKKVTLQLPNGVSRLSGGEPFTGERIMRTDKRDWVSLGRISTHIIERDGRYFLRLADNESSVRRNFPGCIWYPPDESFKVDARFVTYPEGKTLSIVNILGEVSREPCPGYAEFQMKGQTLRLDAIKEGIGLFFVFRDATAGDTTYDSARFIDIENQPPANETFTLDFNKAYNPPCAFSKFTTCPKPPRQNFLKTRIEAGEKYREMR
jgi:uncharacterized protein